MCLMSSKRAGRCKNNLVSDVCPPFSQAVTCPAPAVPVLTSSSFSSLSTSPTTSPDSLLDSTHQSILLPSYCTLSVSSCDVAAANVSSINSAIISDHECRCFYSSMFLWCFHVCDDV